MSGAMDEKGAPMLGRYPMYTTIPVSDLERAAAWYREKLGFEPSVDPPLPHGDEGIFFDAGRATHFWLFPTRAGAGAGHTIAEFVVGDDIDQVVENLRRRGVVFEEYDMPGITTQNGIAEFTGPQGHRTAWFKDSEGNVLAIGSYSAAA